MIAETPLTQTALDALLGLSDDVLKDPIVLQDGSRVLLTSSKETISALGSILRIDNHIVRVLHMSIVDFFTTPSRCTDERLFINRSKHNGELASRCFKTMKALLRRDICRINDPTKLNVEVPDLGKRFERYLPEHLRYACRFWHRHLPNVDRGNDVGLHKQAKDFLFTHLLHWIEVMSLIGDIEGVFTALEAVNGWFQVSLQKPRVIYLLRDNVAVVSSSSCK